METQDASAAKHTFLVRLPLDLHRQLRQEAARNERSINAQVVYLIRQSVNGAA